MASFGAGIPAASGSSATGAGPPAGGNASRAAAGAVEVEAAIGVGVATGTSMAPSVRVAPTNGGSAGVTGGRAAGHSTADAGLAAPAQTSWPPAAGPMPSEQARPQPEPAWWPSPTRRVADQRQQ